MKAINTKYLWNNKAKNFVQKNVLQRENAKMGIVSAIKDLEMKIVLFLWTRLPLIWEALLK